MEESRGSASFPATGMAVENTIEGLYISIFGVDGLQLRSASFRATGMAENPEAITREAERDRTDQEWLISIFGVDGQQPDQGEKWFFSILDDQKPHPEARSKHRIPKAPAKFREYEKDKEYFDPRVVSLGPYHHGKVDLMKMDKHKITAAKQFVDEFISQNGGRGTIYKKFMDLTTELTECYDADEVTTMNDEVVASMKDHVFARMMFLDGCFVLHFIENIMEGGKTKLEISNDDIPLIIRDMFLIENQLPFQVLDALMNLLWGSSSTGKDNSGKKKIWKFIKRKVLNPMGFWPVNSSRSLNWCRAHDSPLHLLDILRTVLLDFPPSKGTKKQSYIPRYFGTVMELKEIGIRFERRSMKSLMGISFKEHLLFPRLLLPTMYINDTTISQLLNLTALEACSDTYSGCGVTSYIHFMDTLINDDADVKKLRSKGILYHSLGSDDKVAHLFNNWPADVKNNLKLYIDVSMQIRRHRHRRVKISIATWWDNYFASPWTAISLVGAGLLLVLTVIQTFFAAFPRG